MKSFFHICLPAYIISSLILFIIIPANSQQIRINEVMSSNREFYSDEDGTFEDWIEILNTGNEPLNLLGYGLSDDAEDPFMWTFPDYEIQPGEYLLIWASGKDRKPVPGEMVNGVKRRYYPGIPGTGVDDLINHATFPDQPATRNVLINSFDAPVDFDDNYGQHLFTWITAPQTGAYRFQIASDDNSRLYIGMDGTPDNVTLIAHVPGWTGPRQWTKFPQQLSGLIHLTEGTSYYLSALMKEGYGGDHITVRWHLPDGTIEEPLSAAHCHLPYARWHTNFRLNSEGEELILTHPNGDIIDEMPAVPIPTNVSLGRMGYDDPQWYYFSDPTPEGPNSTNGAEGITQAPVISPAEGVFGGPVQITIVSPDPQAQIYFTTNGTTPSSTNGTLYIGPFTNNASRYIRAIARKPGWLDSEITAGSYAVASDAVKSFSSNIPVMLIQSFNTPITAGERTPAYMTLWDHELNGRNEILQNPSVSSRMKINLRGSSSMSFPKKGFGFHILNEDESNRKVSLLDLPEEHNWVLHGPYSDKTLMRNALSYAIARDAGHYSPRTKFFELFLHSGINQLANSHYHGVYVLTERIKIAPGRVEIEELEPWHNQYPEISGGYIFKIDRLNPGEIGFITNRGSKFAWVRPNEQTVSIDQRNWLIAWLDSLETTLFGSQFTDPVSGYSAFMDSRSFIDMHLITELSKEIDGYRLSTFFYKDRLGKLKSGPLWDFNLSFGNANYLGGWIPQGWYYSQLNQNDYMYGWYTRLFQDPAFSLAYNRRYRSLRLTAFSNLRLNNRIMSNYDELQEAQERNFQRWNVLGTWIWPNSFIGETYEDEVMWMDNWLRQRLQWMDGQLGEPFTMIHYWNFNEKNDQLTPTWTLEQGEITITEGPQTNVISGTEQEFKARNARFEDPAGAHLRIDDPIGTQLVFHVPSVNYKDPLFSWEARRSTNGANKQLVSYTTDGENFLPIDTFLITVTPKVYSIDLMGYEGVTDNAQLAIKITIAHNPDFPGGTGGNNRIDNVALDGEALQGIIRPPVQTKMLANPIFMIAGEPSINLDLSEYFKHPDGVSLQYTLDDNNQDFAGITLNNHQLSIIPQSQGGSHFRLKIEDGHNPPLTKDIYLLVYPEPAAIVNQPFVFDFWSPDEPEGSFPQNMIFLQSETVDPLLHTVMYHAYSIPASDYASDDQGNIGFPYRNQNRTRINGLNNNGISFINTGRDRDLGAAILAIDTRNTSHAWLTWKASTIRSNSRAYNLRLQYRLDVNRYWKDWKNAEGEVIEYHRSNTPGHSEEFLNIPFPDELLGKPYVQLRWLYYFTGQQLNQDSGARDMLALNKVEISLLPTHSSDTDADVYTVPLRLYPNPSRQGVVYFNRPVSGNIFDIQGQKTGEVIAADRINTSNLKPGVYYFRSIGGETVRFIVL